MLIAALASFILAAQMIDFDMTSDEKRQTGVYKLNDKEKGALQEWIDNNYTKRAQPVKTASKEKGILQENLKNGSQIRLSDGSLWSIHPKDTPITQSWITPVEILVAQSGDPDYPYKLTNTLTGSSVRAKKAQ
jgi:hypothetical protein